MTQNKATQQTAAMRALLHAMAQDLGHPLAAAWEKAYWAAPRHHFLPERFHRGPECVPVDRREEPAEWLRAAYEDEPAITQFNDGEETGEDDTPWPSSSASAPSIVFRMLELLDVRDGQRVLEIGTGTGWNAGLLAQRLGGAGWVTSVEVDPGLAEGALARLRGAGLGVEVVAGDGAEGYAPGAPYDRVVATCSVREVPYAWVGQTAPGGVILTPWDSPWCCYGLLRLTVEGDGTASGRFAPHSAFMVMRGHRADLRIFRDVVRDGQVPEGSVTGLSPWAVAGDDLDARFAVGLSVGDVWHAWQEDPDVAGVAARLWVATVDGTSWAAVDVGGEQEFAVHQYGARRVWDEVAAAYAWWRGAGSPGVERFGLTVGAGGGGGRVWLDAPDRPVA
ncbi:methyltransferase domain-containing protein [Streptomyces lichenis]|uniref:Protein-L-isoaspartate O-methyltransferase n=1 Tax=Streptomyces lichenis TaxID=2306967 RepID=A0ABT0I4H1_9ACTN|nr:methyltransferase domain-containing protein [Streptomyces lichenis]MCK8676181.1 methyltransferase domain-containing protein [Streptomyces lichenis]